MIRTALTLYLFDLQEPVKKKPIKNKKAKSNLNRAEEFDAQFEFDDQVIIVKDIYVQM